MRERTDYLLVVHSKLAQCGLMSIRKRSAAFGRMLAIICRKFQKQPTKLTIFCISYPAHQVPCHSSRWDAWKMPISVLKILININNWFGGADNSIGRVLRQIVAIVGEVIFSGERSLGSMRDSSVSVSALPNVSWKEQIGINIVSYLMDARPIRIMSLGKYEKKRCRAELLITE